MGVGTTGDERGTDSQRGSRVGTPNDDLATAIERHRPELTCLGDVYRNPTTAPLATLAATLVLVVAAWQTYLVAVLRGPVLAGLVALTVAVAYWLASRYWAIQNEHVACVLAHRDLAAAESEATEN